MKIISKIKNASKTYPRLMQSITSGSVYLMQGAEEGIKLTKGDHNDNGRPLGYHGYAWKEESLIDFIGTIEITSTNL